MLNHLLISRCGDVCDWIGPNFVLTPDKATQDILKVFSRYSQDIACDSDIVLIERMDANWLRKFDYLISCVF